MNKPVRRVAIAMLLLFGLLVVNANYIQVIKATEYQQDPGNTRVLLEEYERQRGLIIVNGSSVANSVSTPADQLKYLRRYANGPVYAPATGYYSLIFSNSGIERAENDVLSGSSDSLFVRRLTDLFTGREPRGGNVELTLDARTQQAAYDALTETGATGAIVALDPQTGAILAMVSTPSYDPNLLSSHDPTAIRDYAAQLDAAPVDPRLNRATSDNYPPGSVFKLIVAAAALENGLTPESTIPAPDVLTLPGTSTTLRNFGGSSCNGGADDTLLHALTISCNTAFAQLGIDVGEDNLRDVAERFGIDDTGYDMPLPVAQSSLGSIEDDAALGQSSIGQRDVRLTPIETASIVATIASGGAFYQPHLVNETQEPDLTVIDQAEVSELRQAIDPEIAQDLTAMMVNVVAEGTGTRAQINGLDVAGKTGTAEVEDGVAPHAWFAGFAPADNPQIAVAVFIANGGSSQGETTGGVAAAPIAKTVMEAFLRIEGG
ncbi:MAG: penicillin-binding protein 2 [Geodermatophilaceae bacterium]|nr:penicillin-binding protein 2 [Geodermatophilaceae bacterium]